MYSVVSDIDNYHKFVPWCIGSRVLRRSKEGTHLEAELEVGFQLLRERCAHGVGMSVDAGIGTGAHVCMCVLVCTRVSTCTHL